MLRMLDVSFALLGLFFGFPVLLLIYIIGLFDTGSPLFRQERMGRFQKPFVLIKFRTMALDTESVATHLASRDSVTKFGNFLRRSKLDELPQLWNVLKGEMSLVGPRPGLLTQNKLILERDKLGIYEARPGITGMAQVNKIDMSTPELLAKFDQKMIMSMSPKNYFRYLFLTLLGHGSGDRIQ
ncbi:sugar transferase [Amphritea japonica]|uniref:Sugar transferase n=1 Tax=Amphritea japonica ATCC BAA-1530 TaxID=1278309 RepID=A0A7R6PF21_9GAMM|nr:sugar transferase [Amphritea japonica]BBB25227.1 sugar transferase [Amphritea japonica ATCC BAA-1530]